MNVSKSSKNSDVQKKKFIAMFERTWSNRQENNNSSYNSQGLNSPELEYFQWENFNSGKP